ncbi:threonylcarbamoyl-AMP synthase [Candidatus Woesearchaeota archaeon CG_4_10_14_0_2_um_filter_57_5]|nr:MAG: threonylcarbamoyl-AMP synthase [Candidatus Woesearchaeota archaeon CG1_02_57_44]PIZ50147.1 MAG: threonylcarbamoyl-AMP synthase [Candidatus Woesearchaeota archaeon CG_4_10_14_0_2_um_filter_57_5]
MITLNPDEFRDRQHLLIEEIRKGAVFIHPTDTIYGIGANAQDKYAVQKVRDIKQRPEQPFSVMAPSIDWIRENCRIPKEAEEWLQKLPGPYTFVFKLKNKKAIAPETNNGVDTIGVRIPDHWFAKVVAEAGVPFVTTSANISGMDFMTSMETLHDDLNKKSDFIVYEGEKDGHPSTIVNFAEKEPIVVER